MQVAGVAAARPLKKSFLDWRVRHRGRIFALCARILLGIVLIGFPPVLWWVNSKTSVLEQADDGAGHPVV